MIYAGIGSRETPEGILAAMEIIGQKLGMMGLTLRSGRAPGADTAFEKGARCVNGDCEIFVPWHGFPKGSDLTGYPEIILPASGRVHDNAVESVRALHPNFTVLSPAAVKLLARDYLQIRGTDENSPVTDFVVCCTPDGKASGGTGQAIRLAEQFGIKVINAHEYINSPDTFVRDVVSYAADTAGKGKK